MDCLIKYAIRYSRSHNASYKYSRWSNNHLPRLSAPLLCISRKSIIHILLISANNKHLVKGSIIGINTIVSFSAIITILLSVITHTKVFINWKIMLLKSYIELWYRSNATSHSLVPNSRVEHCDTQVNCNDSWIILCILICSILCVYLVFKWSTRKLHKQSAYTHR